MKKSRATKLFLTELESNPIISLACKRVSLSRQTVYRWRREDDGFARAMDEAINHGTESVLDLVESKLLTNVASGNQRAIESALGYFGKRSERNRIPTTDYSPDGTRKMKTLADLVVAASKYRREKGLPSFDGTST